MNETLTVALIVAAIAAAAISVVVGLGIASCLRGLAGYLRERAAASAGQAQRDALLLQGIIPLAARFLSGHDEAPRGGFDPGDHDDEPHRGTRPAGPRPAEPTGRRDEVDPAPVEGVVKFETGVKIIGRSRFTVESRVQFDKFRPTRLVIRDAPSWAVNDIRVGNRAQFARSVEVPGNLFSEIQDLPVESAFRGMSVTLDVTSLVDDTREFTAQMFGDCIRVDRFHVPTGRSELIPMTSGVAVARSKSVKVVYGPARADTRPRRFVVNNADRWVVSDITFGDRSIMSQPGGIPAGDLSGDFVSFRVLEAGADLTLGVTYVGDDECGEVFSCVVLSDLMNEVESSYPGAQPEDPHPARAH